MKQRTVLDQRSLEDLKEQFPNLPAEYLAYLKQHGWGETDSNKMIYEGPVFPDEIYGGNYQGPDDVIVFGDDFQGYFFGFRSTVSHYGEISPRGEWEEWSDREGFNDYVK